MDCPSLAIGGVEDHIHILYRHSKNLSLADVMEELKTASSKWLKTRGLDYRRFQWQRGYGAFSVSASKVGAVSRYIAGQEKHHRKATFQEEFRRFLVEYEVEYDERYVWD